LKTEEDRRGQKRAEENQRLSDISKKRSVLKDVNVKQLNTGYTFNWLRNLSSSSQKMKVIECN